MTTPRAMEVLLVPDLPIEHWPSMDRYSNRLKAGLARVEGLRVSVAGAIDPLTAERPGAPHSRVVDPGSTHFLPLTGFSAIRRYASRYVLYPRRVRRMRADVLHVLDHSYGHMLLANNQRPSVVTVHDLLPAISVRKGSATIKERFRNWLLTRVLKGLRRADAFIVGTEWIRTELAEFIGDEHRIHIVPFGVDPAFLEPPPILRAALRRRSGIPDDAFVILHVGSLGPRKNLPAVLRSLAALRAAGIPAWLLQVGGALSDEQTADIGALGLREWVTLLGSTREDVLRSAYGAADVLLFPSLYEGFGFPVLEAMASGLPVIASAAGALPEVGGDGAVIVEGHETEPYVTALRQVLDNPSWRDQLVARGRIRAQAFTWEAAARKTAEVYQKIV